MLAKIRRFCAISFLFLFSSVCFAGFNYGSQEAENQSRIDFREINSLAWQLAKSFNAGELSEPVANTELDFLTGFQTYMPDSMEDNALPVFEKAILTAYLDNPNSQELALFNALYHVCRTMLYGNKYGLPVHANTGQHFI